MASGLAAKRLALLKEAVPRISCVLVLSYLVDPIAAPQVKELESAAHFLGVKLLVRDIQTADDLLAAFDAGPGNAPKESLRRPRAYSLLSANEWSASLPSTNCRGCTLTGEWLMSVA
jgi:hypothetical protein